MSDYPCEECHGDRRNERGLGCIACADAVDDLWSELERWRSIPTMDVPGTLHDDADMPTQIAFRLRWLSEELAIRAREFNEARAKTAQLREELDDMIAEYGAAMCDLEAVENALDNAPTPRLNNDRTPSTLAERVEWLVGAWRDGTPITVRPIETQMPELPDLLTSVADRADEMVRRMFGDDDFKWRFDRNDDGDASE